MQLVINAALKTQRAIIDSIAVGRKLVGHYKHSATACERLMEIQREQQSPTVYKVHQDVATRWNSTYLMIQRLLVLKPALAVHRTEANVTLPNSNQWLLLEATKDLLTPFDEATIDLSERSAVASQIIPVSDLICRTLALKDPYGSKVMQQAMIVEMKKRLPQDLHDK